MHLGYINLCILLYSRWKSLGSARQIRYKEWQSLLQVQGTNQDGTLLVQAGRLKLRVQQHEVERAAPEMKRKSAAALFLQSNQDSQPGRS